MCKSWSWEKEQERMPSARHKCLKDLQRKSLKTYLERKKDNKDKTNKIYI